MMLYREVLTTDTDAIRSGDLLLYRAPLGNEVFSAFVAGDILGAISLFVSYIIGVAGRGPYSHAAIVFWDQGHPFVAEVREGYGGRIVTLDSQVERYKERIDLYSHNPRDRYSNFDVDEFILNMKLRAGTDYGWWAIAKAALWHLPFVRLLQNYQHQEDAIEDNKPAFCSHAIAHAARKAGVDVLPGLLDRLTEPSDLSRSLFFEYKARLTK